MVMKLKIGQFAPKSAVSSVQKKGLRADPGDPNPEYISGRCLNLRAKMSAFTGEPVPPYNTRACIAARTVKSR